VEGREKVSFKKNEPAWGVYQNDSDHEGTEKGGNPSSEGKKNHRRKEPTRTFSKESAHKEEAFVLSSKEEKETERGKKGPKKG